MILDTMFLVDALRGDPGARAFLEAAEARSEALRVPAPALAAFWEAAARSRAPPRQSEALRSLLEPSAIPYGAHHAAVTGRLLADEAGALDIFDAMVAATAIVEGEALITRNHREFSRIPALRLVPY